MQKNFLMLVISVLQILVTFPFLFATQSFAVEENTIDKSSQLSAFDNKAEFAFVTYVLDYEQERKAAVLIKSIRHNAGRYSQFPVYVVLGDTANYPCYDLKSEGVFLLPLKLENEIINYPLAIKAYAAAEVEKIVSKDVQTLAWFDPETIVLGSLEELELKNKYVVALRPVFLTNSIGLSLEAQPNAYWSAIYNALGLTVENIPIVETIGENNKIRAYYNCEIISVNPARGIFQEWVKQLTPLIKNAEYQKEACTGFLQKLFLHQAVLSAVISSKVEPQEIYSLPLTCGYPFNLHERMTTEKKAQRLNSLSCVILESVWNQNPNWMKTITIEEPLKTWITNTYFDFLKISPDIYRIEGSCNSYLVTTKDGSVLIDPAGAMISPEWFQKIISKYPLKAILLTHGHNDHRESIGFWKKDSPIPVIAQREFVEFIRYNDRLANFFARRNFIWQRQPVPKDTVIEINSLIEPTVFFTDSYTHKQGGYNFKVIHTSGETPDNSVIYIPELRAAFVGDAYYSSFPNLYTLRGTKPRWALDYIVMLDTALNYKPEYFLMGHGTPLIGVAKIQKDVKEYRDAIQYVHDKTVKGLNEGKDVYTLMQEIQLPEKYNNIFQAYGKVSWSVRGIYEGYVGWFDENPTNMYNEPASSIYPDLIKILGSDALLKCAGEYLNNKEFVKVLHLTDIILLSESENQRALNFRLQALKELRIRSRNYIENIWLDYGIRSAEEKL